MDKKVLCWGVYKWNDSNASVVLGICKLHLYPFLGKFLHKHSFDEMPRDPAPRGNSVRFSVRVTMNLVRPFQKWIWSHLFKLFLGKNVRVIVWEKFVVLLLWKPFASICHVLPSLIWQKSKPVSWKKKLRSILQWKKHG